MGAEKKELAVDGRAAKTGVELVKMAAAGGQIIGEEIGERNNLGGSVFGEGIGHGSAAVAAAQQSVPHGGVGRIAEGRERFEQNHAGSGCRTGLNKFATIHVVTLPCDCRG